MIVIIFILIILVISIIYSHIKIDITTYNIEDNKIDKDITLMFLSDLHNRKVSDKLIDIIKENKPDIIICGGDMINERITKTNNFIKLVNYLKDHDVYYTFGNHEEMLSDDEKETYIKVIDNSSIKLFNNTKKMISKNILLSGFVSGVKTYKNFKKKGINKDMIISNIGEIDKDKFNILIAHNPLEFDSYVQYGSNLVLSGHVHGGLARIPIINKGILSPDISFFPKYDSGLYEKKNTKMIVSRGIGYSERIPFRIFNPGEVVIVNLKKK